MFLFVLNNFLYRRRDYQKKNYILFVRKYNILEQLKTAIGKFSLFHKNKFLNIVGGEYIISTRVSRHPDKYFLIFFISYLG